MNSQTLNKLTPESREKIIYLEGRLRELDEQIKEIDNLILLSYQDQLLE